MGITCRRVWSVTTKISNYHELTWAILIKINYAFLLVHDIMTLISFLQILARLTNSSISASKHSIMFDFDIKVEVIAISWTSVSFKL